MRPLHALLAPCALTLSGAALGQGASPACALEETRLLAADGASGDQLGQAIAIDGSRIAVGAGGDDDLGADSGSVYVFLRVGATWTQEVKLTAADGQAGDRFGASASLASGSILAGAREDDDGGLDSGSAYVFALGAAWSQQAKLLGSDTTAGDQFGRSVCIWSDTAVVGAPLADAAGLDSGSAYVFVRSGAVWQQQAKLAAADASAGDQFGGSVSISGERILVGAPLAGGIGAAYVFDRSGSAWTQTSKLIAGDASGGDRFGRAVALDGDDAAIGAPLDDDLGSDSGSLYVFSRLAGSWTQVGKLLAGDGAPADLLGWSVAIGDGRAVAGAVWDDDAGDKSGSTYVFARVGGNWSQALKLAASAGAAYDSFGVSTAISGELVAVGAYQSSVMGTGSAYAVRLLAAPQVYCTAKLNSCGALPAITWTGIPSASASSGFLLSASGAREGKSGLVLYGNAGPATIPFQNGTLCVAPAGLKRGVPVVASGGTPGPACDAQLVLDWNAFAAGLLGGHPQAWLRVPGTAVQAQWWGRDTPSECLLSDALSYDTCP
jgi:FG-GAP repeat protein